jgi:hypothetical protein
LKTTKEKTLLLVLSLVCLVAVIFMIVALCMPQKAELKPFTPPPFDDTATIGTPIVPDGLGYNTLYRDGMAFKVGICGKINVTGKTADIYLTNIEENNVWLKARFYDAAGNIIGECGLIKPGEYLKSVELLTVPNPSAQYTIKIMSYEPDTYRSLGAITLTPKMNIITE